MQVTNVDFNKAKPVYDRRAIMRHAWEIVRRAKASRIIETHNERLARALRVAWRKVKEDARFELAMLHSRLERERLAQRPVDQLKASIESLENKTFLGHEGMRKLSELKSALHTAQSR